MQDQTIKIEKTQMDNSAHSYLKRSFDQIDNSEFVDTDNTFFVSKSARLKSELDSIIGEDDHF